MILDRFELAEILGPALMAEAVHQQLNHTGGPLPVAEIATALGIAKVKIQRFDGFEGMLLTDTRRSVGAILANTARGERRARFTIAHELGHFLLERHILTSDEGFQCRATDMRQGNLSANNQHKRQETETNRFAAELLAPPHLVRNSLNDDPDLQEAFQMAKSLNISFEVGVRRMIEVGDEPAAAVWSHNGKIRYSLRSKGFPFIACSARTPLPKNSMAAKHVASGRRGTSAFVQSPPACWVNDHNQDIQEQTRLGTNDHAVTLLWAQ